VTDQTSTELSRTAAAADTNV